MNNLKLNEQALVENISGVREKLTELEKQLTVPGQNKGGIEPIQKQNWVIDTGFCEHDVKNQHTFFSASFLNMVGYAPDDLADIYYFQHHLIHQDDRRKVKKLWNECIQGKASTSEFRIQHQDKSSIWVSSEFQPVIDDKGVCHKIFFSISNIDKIKKQFEALQDIGARYKNLFEKNLFGIVRGDLVSDLITDYNKKAAELLGSTLTSFQDFANFLFKFSNDDLLNELYEKGKFSNKECKILLADESARWLQVSAELTNNETMVEIYFHDITDSKNSILELQKINLELDNFVYHSSHDLKSPLKSILGLINILKLEKDPVSQKECIEMIEGSIVRLDKLVNDLLSLSRNNRIDDNLMPMNLMIELNNTITNFYHTANTKNLEIIPLVYQPFPLVTDITRVRIILNNLISNAFKYRSFDKPSSYVRIEIRVDKEKAVIVVEDNGIGIALAKQEKVFDMFYRASEYSDGSGLGLYIVKNMIDKLKGTMSLKSKEGVGSAFTVEFPNHWDGKW